MVLIPVMITAPNKLPSAAGNKSIIDDFGVCTPLKASSLLTATRKMLQSFV